jgi:hypothetical protein
MVMMPPLAGIGTGSNKTAMPAGAAAAVAAGNRSTATATAAGGFTLPSALTPKAAAAGAGTVLQSSDVNSASLRGPEPIIFNTPGAKKTVLIGCALPLEGTDHDVGGRAVLQGVKMAITDLLPELKLGINVNLTCLNSKVCSGGACWFWGVGERQEGAPAGGRRGYLFCTCSRELTATLPPGAHSASTSPPSWRLSSWPRTARVSHVHSACAPARPPRACLRDRADCCRLASLTRVLLPLLLPLLLLQTVAVIGEICSAASVAAGGVANEFKIPLISPASSSPQLTGIDYFYRTVPSDR